MTDPTPPTAPLKNSKLLDEDDDTFAGSANPGAAAVSEFGDGEEYDMPPELCGIFFGHVSEVKDNPNNSKQKILNFTSEDDGSSGESTSAFITVSDSRQKARLKLIALALGLNVVPTERGFRIPGAGLKSAKGKACMFIADTYVGKDGEARSSLAWGMPKEEKSSKEWKAFAAGYNGGKGFTPEQIAAIKSGGGIIAAKHHALFR